MAAYHLHYVHTAYNNVHTSKNLTSLSTTDNYNLSSTAYTSNEFNDYNESSPKPLLYV